MTPSSANLRASDLERRDLALGFLRVGYHFIVGRDGRIEVGRPYSQASIHDPPGDARRTLSVCLVGGDEDGVPVDNFTPEQKRAFIDLLSQVNTEHPETQGNLVVRTPATSSDEVAEWGRG